jgi:hypothetical protein
MSTSFPSNGSDRNAFGLGRGFAGGGKESRSRDPQSLRQLVDAF